MRRLTFDRSSLSAFCYIRRKRMDTYTVVAYPKEIS